MFKNVLKRGDIVEVLQPSEILKTLDSRGTLDNLPFMSEMLDFCGKMYKVKSRIEKTCMEVYNYNNLIRGVMREFNLNDVVFLEDLRCSGASHGNCQAGCMIFWKEAWLNKSENNNGNKIQYQDADEARNKLITTGNKGAYFCQSTQLHAVTKNISGKKRLIKLIYEIIIHDIEVTTAIKSIIKPLLRKSGLFPYIKGNLNKTYADELNLQPGELVEVKSYDEILKTLDKQGRNKGLRFYLGMKQYCGKKFRVRNRIERMINEVTGEMIELKNSVILDNVVCTYDYEFLGCPRLKFQIWREIWLKRICRYRI